MSTKLWVKHEYAKCFGKWVVSDPECIRCALSDNCEKRTKAKIEEAEKPSEPENNELEVPKPVTPLEYLLQSLDGKYNQEIETKDNAVLHKFKKDGKTVIAIAIGAMGKIKVVSIVKGKSRIFGSLNSIEEVESVLTEML